MTTPQEPWKRWLLASQRRAAILVLPSRIDPSDFPRLSRRLRALASNTHTPVILCDAGALTHPDGVTVDALARLQLTARRLGTRLALTRTPEKLHELLDFAGLGSVLPTRVSALESLRKPE